jgi:hypothetical protein
MRGTYEELRRTRHRHAPIAPHPALRDSASVSPRRTRTADYSESARARLAEAVVDARTAAGWPTTMHLVRAVGRSQRAIYALENAEPTVGQSILQAVGATLGKRLRDWHANTPREILEGKPAPSLTLADGAPPVVTPSESDLALTEEADRLVELIRGVLELQGIKVTPQRVAEFLDQVGVEITAEDDNH